MPWKNGAGETVEIAVFPAGASVDDFDWRISMATVASDGPFSIFPGVDRTLSILSGSGMVLAIADAEAVPLTRDSQPLPFAADVAVNATLTGGPITDLNVMTRRGRFHHSVTRVKGDVAFGKPMRSETVFLLATGNVSTTFGKERFDMGALDALVIDEVGTLKAGDTPCYVVRLTERH